MKTRWRTKKLRLVVLMAIFLGLLLGMYVYRVLVSPVTVGNVAGDQIAPSNGDVVEPARVRRQNIYDLNLQELALSFLIASVYIKPLELQRDEGALGKLSQLLDIEENELSRKVASEKSFVWVGRNVPDDRAEKIKKLGLSGVYLTKEEVRLYPNGRHAGHVIGFAKGEQGLAGIEAYYDNVLGGSSEAAAVNLKNVGISADDLAQKGASLILTLDLRIQKYLEKNVAELFKKTDARSGVAVIMVPESGEILAMANIPDYDPNFFWRSIDSKRRNRAVNEPIPVGGLLKAFRMAAELEGGNIPDFILQAEEVSPQIIEPRRYKKVVAGQRHEEANAYWQKLSKGRYWSAPEKNFSYTRSDEALVDFSRRLGLTEKVPIDLPTLSETSSTQNGEEFSLTDGRSKATVLQLVTAFSRMLSGGKEVVPHLLQDVWFEEEGKRIPAVFTTGKNIKGWDVNRDVVRLFNELTPDRVKKAILIESLTPEEDVDGDGAGTNEVEVKSDLAGGVVPEGEEPLVPKIRYANTVLGAVPSHHPEIALALVLDGALIDQTASSVCQGVVENILTKALVWRKVTKTSDTPDSRLKEKEIFAMWSRLHEGREQGRSVQKKYKGKMPKVTGLSLRKALQLLANYDLQIRVVGSGGVIVQHPPSGESFQKGADCLLELAVE